MERTSRRRILATSGGALAAALAGCLGNGGNGGADTVPGSDYPAVDEWLTETEVGGADDTYDGNLQDLREQSSVSVDVGAEGNGGNYAFGPSAIVVTPGTEVTWEWTGRGQAHNVEAEPEEQIGESDYEFSSGEPVQSDAETYGRTLDSEGVALYHCEPHLALGMKGAVAVAPS